MNRKADKLQLADALAEFPCRESNETVHAISL